MNLQDGKYLKYDIIAFSGNQSHMWLIVFDGRYNYMLFNTSHNEVLRRYEANHLPSNGIGRKYIEYYSTFDTALDNLMRVIVNGNKWEPVFLNNVFLKY